MTASEGQALLLLARAAIVDRLLGGGALQAARRGVAVTPALEERRGASGRSSERSRSATGSSPPRAPPRSPIRDSRR